MKKSIVLLVAAIALLVVALPIASAQEATPDAVVTVTFSETEINNSFRVTNPIDRRLTNVHVDLQSANGGQVEITALYTWRSTHGVKSANVAVVLMPQIINGRLFWNVVSITANGQPASSDVVAEVNANLAASWRRWIASHIPAGYLTNVTITDDDITLTYTRHA